MITRNTSWGPSPQTPRWWLGFVASFINKLGNGGVAEWFRQGPAKPCTRVRFPPPPRAIGAVVARFPDTEEVTGSNPVSPTKCFTSSEPPSGGSFIFGCQRF